VGTKKRAERDGQITSQKWSENKKKNPPPTTKTKPPKKNNFESWELRYANLNRQKKMKNLNFGGKNISYQRGKR